MTVKNRRPSDADRLLAVLEDEGRITSWEIRTRSISGNPSQRVEELRERGCLIDADPDTYKDPTGRTRRVVNYIFNAGPDPIRAEEYRSRSGADGSGVGSASAAVSSGPNHPEGETVEGIDGETSAGAASSSAPADPPRLFPMEEPSSSGPGHTDLDQREAA